MLTIYLSVLVFRERLDEIQSLAALVFSGRSAFDQKRVLNRLDVLSRKAEELGQISAAARCEELIGKHRGIFTDRTALELDFDPSKLTVEQLDVLADQFIRQARNRTDSAIPFVARGGRESHSAKTFEGRPRPSGTKEGGCAALERLNALRSWRSRCSVGVQLRQLPMRIRLGSASSRGRSSCVTHRYGRDSHLPGDSG